ncbi:OmpA family protein [Flexistipes sp.]|uniref:OmpA family protein n=1 Tax=Flexistipes sp. TaxID=3088135 RepID=UPI002E1A8E36|nr:OmpA family protein [Flexistipes sp.]
MDAAIIHKQVDDYIYKGTTFLKSNQYVIAERVESQGSDIQNPFALMKAEVTPQKRGTEKAKKHGTDKDLSKNEAVKADNKTLADEQKNLLATVYFAFDEYNISPEGYEKLKGIVLKYKDKNKPTLKITGYTDCVGSKEYNNMLALKRAMTVAGYFKTKGFDTTVEGKGDCCFKRTEGLSRRAEVEILTKKAVEDAVREVKSE